MKIILLALLLHCVSASTHHFGAKHSSLRTDGQARTESFRQLAGKLQQGLENVEAALHRDKWTMLIGDSVLAQEFLALAKVLFTPTCKGTTFREELNVERADPAGFFLTAPIEYVLACKKVNGTRTCELSHEDCLHFTVPEPCPSPRSDPFCGHVGHRLCSQQEWQTLVEKATAPDVDFALSYHWAPGPGLSRIDPDVGDLVAVDPGAAAGQDVALLQARFAGAQPGAMLMNNCLHAWPYSWLLPLPAWQRRLTLFQAAIRENLKSVSAAGYKGRFAFMGCLPLACTERFAWKGWSRDGSNCQKQNSELQAVNIGIQRLFDSLDRGSSFVNSWAVASANPNTSIDGIHPCWTRPCEWESGSPQPTGIYAQKWSFWEDTNSSVCLGVSAQHWSGLSSGRLPPAEQIAATPLPSVADLQPSLFVNDPSREKPQAAAAAAASSKPLLKATSQLSQAKQGRLTRLTRSF